MAALDRSAQDLWAEMRPPPDGPVSAPMLQASLQRAGLSLGAADCDALAAELSRLPCAAAGGGGTGGVGGGSNGGGSNGGGGMGGGA
eukprot:1862144-Prymnesium_polylepis.1